MAFSKLFRTRAHMFNKSAGIAYKCANSALHSDVGACPLAFAQTHGSEGAQQIMTTNVFGRELENAGFSPEVSA